MAQPFLGEICCFGFNFAPRGWAFCNGQILGIQQYTALFSLLGTTYGGNGTTTFALPNLQGRIPMHWGTSPGFNTVIGQVQGQTTVTLLTSEIPQHNHGVISAAPGSLAERSPQPSTSSFLSSTKGESAYMNPPVTPNATFSPKAISNTGGSQAHENMQPYLTLNFCIAMDGVYPARN